MGGSEQQGFQPSYKHTEKVHDSWAELTVYLHKGTKIRLCWQPISNLRGHPCTFTDLVTPCFKLNILCISQRD